VLVEPSLFLVAHAPKAVGIEAVIQVLPLTSNDGDGTRSVSHVACQYRPDPSEESS
jgi:hypothetical protein